MSPRQHETATLPRRTSRQMSQLQDSAPTRHLTRSLTFMPYPRDQALHLLAQYQTWAICTSLHGGSSKMKSCMAISCSVVARRNMVREALVTPS